MNILSLDTSTDVLSIGLKTEHSYEERLIKGNFSHSECLLKEIKSLLERASLKLSDLELLCATKGPGSFTGLRVGLATLKGIRAASGAKLVSVPTLDAMAEAITNYSPYPVLAVIDARKKRYYAALFDCTNKVLIPAQDSDPELIFSLLKDYEKILVTGADAPSFTSLAPKEMKDKLIIDSDAPHNLSKAIITLSLEKLEKVGEDDIGEGPMYIRRSDAEEALLKKMEDAK